MYTRSTSAVYCVLPTLSWIFIHFQVVQVLHIQHRTEIGWHKPLIGLIPIESFHLLYEICTNKFENPLQSPRVVLHKKVSACILLYIFLKMSIPMSYSAIPLFISFTVTKQLIPYCRCLNRYFRPTLITAHDCSSIQLMFMFFTLQGASCMIWVQPW